jgi:hypothetical protein
MRRLWPSGRCRGEQHDCEHASTPRDHRARTRCGVCLAHLWAAPVLDPRGSGATVGPAPIHLSNRYRVPGPAAGRRLRRRDRAGLGERDRPRRHTELRGVGTPGAARVGAAGPGHAPRLRPVATPPLASAGGGVSIAAAYIPARGPIGGGSASRGLGAAHTRSPCPPLCAARPRCRRCAAGATRDRDAPLCSRSPPTTTTEAIIEPRAGCASLEVS